MAQVSTPMAQASLSNVTKDRRITHFRPKTRNGTFLTPAATVYVQLERRQRPISCTYTAGECYQGPNPEVYVQLERRQRPISCTYTAGECYQWPNPEVYVQLERRQRPISCTYTGRGGGAGPQRGWSRSTARGGGKKGGWTRSSTRADLVQRPIGYMSMRISEYPGRKGGGRRPRRARWP